MEQIKSFNKLSYLFIAWENVEIKEKKNVAWCGMRHVIKTLPIFCCALWLSYLLHFLFSFDSLSINLFYVCECKKSEIQTRDNGKHEKLCYSM